MSIKLIATDMDGTLLNSQKQLPDDFISWVNAHPDMTVMIASGRQYFTLEKDFMPLRDRLTFVADNGSLVCRHGEIIYKNLMTREDVLLVLNTAKAVPHGIPVVCGVHSAWIDSADEEFCTNVSHYYARVTHVDNIEDALDRDDVVKLTFYFKHQAAEENFAPFANLPEHLCALVTGPSWIDAANSSASKGKAIEAVQKALGITPEESMAFGDYLNDLSMFDYCHESYAMANAHDAVKAKARHMTVSNDEDGVMRILRKL